MVNNFISCWIVHWFTSHFGVFSVYYMVQKQRLLIMNINVISYSHACPSTTWLMTLDGCYMASSSCFLKPVRFLRFNREHGIVLPQNFIFYENKLQQCSNVVLALLTLTSWFKNATKLYYNTAVNIITSIFHMLSIHRS